MGGNRMNVLNSKEEENIHGFTRDMKIFLMDGDFRGALILLDDLKRYLEELRTKKRQEGCYID
jgi:hypothetical protein